MCPLYPEPLSHLPPHCIPSGATHSSIFPGKPHGQYSLAGVSKLRHSGVFLTISLLGEEVNNCINDSSGLYDITSERSRDRERFPTRSQMTNPEQGTSQEQPEKLTRFQTSS